MSFEAMSKKPILRPKGNHTSGQLVHTEEFQFVVYVPTSAHNPTDQPHPNWLISGGAEKTGLPLGPTHRNTGDPSSAEPPTVLKSLGQSWIFRICPGYRNAT